jgi:arsenical pump membrane protein
MISFAVAHLVLPLIVAVSIVSMLIRPRALLEVYLIGRGALLLPETRNPRLAKE